MGHLKSSIILKILLHTLPLWPLLYRNLNLTLASILLLCLPYIKVMKLNLRCRELKEKEPGSHEYERTAQTLDFWLSLTFLKSPPGS